jgi:outer membrane receptor protein involved in Fe transport
MKFLGIILILITCYCNLSAQNKIGSINATVIDKKTGQPIEYATVQITLPTNNLAIRTAISNKKGKFNVDSIPMGTYSLKINFMGLVVPAQTVTLSTNESVISLGNISMELSSNTLQEVSVTAKKNMLNSTVGKKVYNTSQDIMAQSGSASDILRNIPSVEVDIEGNISLRGSGELMILINGRPSPLMGKNRAEVLQQIPANTIERIEVITNPSAKYRPDGTAGMINIVMKKNIKAGFNGNVTGNIGNKERANGSVTLNYKTTKLNTFATYSIRQDERNRFGNTNRQFLDSVTGATTGFYTENYRSKARPLSHLLRGGFDYTIDKLNSIGLSGSYLKTSLTRYDLYERTFFDKNKQITQRLDRTRYAPAVEFEKDITAFWQHNYGKEGKELRFEFTASSQSEDEKNYYNNQYYYPVKPSIPDNNFVYQIEHNQQATVDFVNPLGEDAKLELGYAGSFIQQDIDFLTENYNPSTGLVIKNPLTSNRFKLNQKVHAIYGTYSNAIGEIEYSLGLRAEQSFIESNLVTRDSIIKNQYFNVFPTVQLSYKLSKGQLQLNYSKRVNRPEGDDLNPFPEYMDPINLRAGNPYLLPEFIHSLEFGYQWKNKIFTIVPSIYYRYKYNGFTSITQKINDTAFLTTKQNLSNDQSTGFELVVSAKPTKTITANLSTNVFFNTINFGTTTAPDKKSIWSMNTNFNASAAITKTTMFQFTCIYRSARQTIQGFFDPTFVMNMGLRQDMMKNKLSVVATLSDVFSTLKQHADLNTKFLVQNQLTSRDAQVFYLGFNYRFGKTTKKAEDKMQFDNAL